jgi:hypothetical protein
LEDLAVWFERNEWIQALQVWGPINEACKQVGLYAPFEAEAWREIIQAHESNLPTDPMEKLILKLYGPGGVGHNTLRAELRDAPLLKDQQGRVTQVLDSLADSRYYVAICGALPLIEGVLAYALGKWNEPHKLDLGKRWYEEPETLTDAEDAELVMNAAAVEMVMAMVPSIWKPGRHDVGSVSEELRRHLALHGTAVGWETPENAIRVLLLLAAVSQVAGPLLSPRS